MVKVMMFDQITGVRKLFANCPTVQHGLSIQRHMNALNAKAAKMNEYISMCWKMRNGFITLQEWQDYCAKLLDEKLQENADVFIRLKDR